MLYQNAADEKLPLFRRRAEALAALEQAPGEGAWRKLGEVRHVFTHFALRLDVYSAEAKPGGEGWWGDAAALPSVFKKAAALGRSL